MYLFTYFHSLNYFYIFFTDEATEINGTKIDCLSCKLDEELEKDDDVSGEEDVNNDSRMERMMSTLFPLGAEEEVRQYLRGRLENKTEK